MLNLEIPTETMFFASLILSLYALWMLIRNSRPRNSASVPSSQALDSDFGRKFGWFIEKDGEKIGELDYLRWDSMAQFWHDYRLTWRKPEDAVVGREAWFSAKLVLRNRRYTDVVIDSFLTSTQREEGVISIRFAYVPEERIRADENGTLHGEQKLNAKS